MARRLQDRSARMWVFHLKHLRGVKGQLSFNITREVCDYLADYLPLAHVTSTFLRFFNFQTSTWDPKVHLRVPIEADNHSSWVVLEGGRVFCCGGYNKATAYMLARDGSVEQKTNMSEVRCFHGLLCINKAFYVFGGYDLIKTCEKFQLPNSKWTLLPSMREARSCFNPCMLLEIVYLCGDDSSRMEAFAPHTDTFLPLQISFPVTSSCCLYVHNHLLVLHSRSHIYKFVADGQLVSQVRSPTIEKHQNSQPVVHKADGVFYMVWKGKCLSFSMETGARGPKVA